MSQENQEDQETRAKQSVQLLRIDASSRKGESVSRRLADELVERFVSSGAEVVQRDTAPNGDGAIPYLDEGWIAARGNVPEELDEAQRSATAFSDQLISELQQADVLVLSTPIYNFGLPASLKAWVDQVVRARVTFRYSEAGPEGLLSGRKAYLVIASDGTEVDSEIDFATPYLRHILRFVGIEDVTVIAADRKMFRGETAVEEARQQIASLEL